MNNNLKKIAFTGIALATLALPLAAFAADCIPTPDNNFCNAQGVTGQTIVDLVKKIITYMMAIGVLVAVGFIVWGGISYMAAGADEEAATAAKGRIKNGIIGFAVVVGVGLILQTVASVIQSRTF